MKYIGQFRDKEDILHTITITTKVGTGTTNMVLSTSPFVEELEGDENTIFKPCKYSSATVRILAKDYMWDIFQSKALDVSVELADEKGNVEWTGFVTPNLYDMGYETDKEELEIECIDALSSLQYFKYTSIDEKPKTKKFLDIIKHILYSKTPYKYMYFPSFLDGITLDKLKICEQNFFGDDNWTMLEVMEEICRYLNVTCVASGDKVYFINYSSLGKVEYIKYTIANNTSINLSTVGTTYTINQRAYSDSGGTISLLPSFNQISVISKINEYKELLPDVFEEKYLNNANGEWNNISSYILDGASCNATISGVLGRYRFVTNLHYKTYYYDKSTGEQLDIDTCSKYADLLNYVGATLLLASFEDYNRMNFDTIYVSKTNKTLTNYILIHLHDTQAGKVVFSTVVSDIPETYIGKNTKMIIKGSIRCMDRANWMYIPTSYGNKKDNFSRLNLYLECKLKWGDYYYQNYVPRENGYIIYRSGVWVKNETTFRLYFNAPDTAHINNRDFSVLDTSGDYAHSDLPSGYVIPLPESATVLGSIPEFSIYTRGRVDGSYRLDAIWLKDFSIQLAISKDSNIKADEWETDTQYTNVINEEYVEEGDEIECKINTWDNKAPTYSVVMYSDENTLYYLDSVTNNVSGNTYRLEEHIIYDYVTQYKLPSIKLDINIKRRLNPYDIVKVPYISSNKKFIIDSYSKDYYSCNNNIKLVEKWNL